MCSVVLQRPVFRRSALRTVWEGAAYAALTPPGALAADEALKGQGDEPRFRVRETPDWKMHAADIEAEMLKRGMMFEVIDWSEDQATLPFKP